MDPFAVFETLGPVKVYRHPDAIGQQWPQVEQAQAELQRRFDACRTDRERLSLTNEVTRALVSVARQRACDCQIQNPGLACEDLDIHTVLANWVEFVRTRM